jgi:hypothetical protein
VKRLMTVRQWKRGVALKKSDAVKPRVKRKILRWMATFYAKLTF